MPRIVLSLALLLLAIYVGNLHAAVLSKTAQVKMRAENPACSSDTEYMDCDTATKFRMIDGTCNGLTSPRLGSRGTQLKRLLPGIPTLISVPTYLFKPVRLDSPGDMPGIGPAGEGEGEMMRQDYEGDYEDGEEPEDGEPEVDCKPRMVGKPCYEIKNRKECLTSLDPRSNFEGQPCVWCLTPGTCPHDNVCEPQYFLENQGKREEKDFESCLENDQVDCKPRMAGKPCFQIKNREECLTSLDPRSNFEHQPCAWCLTPGTCPHGNVCEPQYFLENQGKREEKDFESCLVNDQDCQLDNLNYPGDDIRRIDNIESWQECGHMCNQETGCVGWSWHKPSYWTRPKSCYLKSSLGLYNSTGVQVVSGSRGCPPFRDDIMTDLQNVNFFGVRSMMLNPQHCDCSPDECVQQALVMRPSARLVSKEFSTNDDDATDPRLTHMVPLFGQFLDHDLSMTPEEESCPCCENGSPNDDNCMPIDIPLEDQLSKGVPCLPFSRSVVFCKDNPGNLGKPEQMNAITAYVDASNVYGSSKEEEDLLRSKVDGKLILDEHELLPILNRAEDDSEGHCFQASGSDCITSMNGSRTAGDTRAHEWPGLTAIHTLFAREHNRICDELKTHPDVQPDWTDEDYFQNARRILISEWQKIVYGDWLPLIVGQSDVNDFSLDPFDMSIYEPEGNDPSISNSFATAGFRFGHSMIQGLIKNALQYNSKSFNLGDTFFNSATYEAFVGNYSVMEEILFGLVLQNPQKFDRHITNQLTERLFANNARFMGEGEVSIELGHDLMARNIQRGRDHGLPSYTAFYNSFGLNDTPSTMDCWAQRPQTISESNWRLLEKIYLHPHHIDLVVGGFAEEPYNGGVVGQTFQQIIGKQFKALRHGDRFFFTHEGNMDEQELEQVRQRTLGDIICDNTNIPTIRENVFRGDTPFKKCPTVSGMDMSKFQVFRATKDDSKPTN